MKETELEGIERARALLREALDFPIEGPGETWSSSGRPRVIQAKRLLDDLAEGADGRA